MLRVQARNEEAFVTLYRRHVRLLRTVIQRVINNPADIDELIYDVFLQVWQQAGRYQEKSGRVLSWIITLARRRAIDLVRKKHTYQQAEDRFRSVKAMDAGHDMQRGADEEAATAEKTELFARLMGTLPQEQREAVIFVFYRGFTQREIAAHTAIPLGTIKTRIELALRKLRKALLALGDEAEWLPMSGR